MADAFITGYRYYYEKLPQHMKTIYMNMYNGLKNRQTDFTFFAAKNNGLYPPHNLVIQTLEDVIRDNPSLYYASCTNASVGSDLATGMIHVQYVEYYTPQQHLRLEQDLRMRAAPILEFLRNQLGDYARIYDLYRYMIATIRPESHIPPNNTLDGLEVHSITGPLIHRRSVCAGYSTMFKLLCDQLGIPCFIIYGRSKREGGGRPHGWNAVLLKGKYYHIDVTFDSCLFHATQKYDYKYFLVSDQTMMADHEWDRSRFPRMPNEFV